MCALDEGLGHGFPVGHVRPQGSWVKHQAQDIGRPTHRAIAEEQAEETPRGFVWYVEVGHGGQRTSARANVVLNGTIPVRNCRFFSSTGYGVLKRAADTTDYTQSNTFEGTPLGTVGDL